MITLWSLWRKIYFMLKCNFAFSLSCSGSFTLLIYVNAQMWLLCIIEKLFFMVLGKLFEYNYSNGNTNVITIPLISDQWSLKGRLDSCTISNHIMSHRDVAKMLLNTTTTNQYFLLSIKTAHDLQDKEWLIGKSTQVLKAFPVEVFPPAMLQGTFQWQHNTWHQVSRTQQRKPNLTDE